MTDEQRGGLYFREARFFLAGDRDSALRHIHEARGLMGYMRDMKSLGGPEIQVRYATLGDGTVIKATLMNGQYQAYIESPFGKAEEAKKVYRLVVAGTKQDPLDYTVATPFKWHEDYGFVDLPLPSGYVLVSVDSISEDGLMVSGTVHPSGDTATAHYRFIYWTSTTWTGVNTTIVSSSDIGVPARNKIIDAAGGDQTIITSPPVLLTVNPYEYKHRYTGNGHIFVGSLSVAYPPEPGHTINQGTIVERSATAISTGDDIVTTLISNNLIKTKITDSDDTGNILVGSYWNAGMDAEEYRKWTRPNSDSPYVMEVIHPDFPSDIFGDPISISRDGGVICGHRRRLRTPGDPSVWDLIPTVYSATDGVVDVLPFTDPPLFDYLQEIYSFVNSIGTAVVGQSGIGNTHEFYEPVAWIKNGETNTWEFIPDFYPAPFFGAITAVN